MATAKTTKVRKTPQRVHSIRQDSFRATVVIKDGQHVATVKFYQPSSTVTVNVTQTAEAAQRCVDAGFTQDRVAEYDQPFEYQSDTAGGYGYDKSTAALAGMVIDGHVMADNSGGKLPFPDGAKGFPRDFKAPPGYFTTNWSDKDGVWLSCYKQPGLRYLQEIGYTLVEVI